MEQNLTQIEIICLSIRSEEDAAEFYGRLAKAIKNEFVRAKYEALAREEIGHRQILANLYKKITGSASSPPKIPGHPKTAEGGDPAVVNSLDFKAIDVVLEFAIQREEAAREFYKMAAAQMTENNSKRTFEYLADIENGHASMLRAELKAYKRDKNWYADNPDIQLVGP